MPHDLLKFRTIGCLLATMTLGLCLSQLGFGQEMEAAMEVTSAEPPAPAEPDWATDTKAAAIAAHNGWMLVSCALVLFMTAPGLALFYGGLVRKKNILSVMMQCMFLMGMMTVIWALYGYSLAFGEGNKWIGDTSYLFMQGVQREWDEAANAPVTPMYDDSPLTMYSHVIFQGMFFIITPAIICGAFAERMKFSAMALFMLLWGTLIYCPLAHWVWGGGILAYDPDEPNIMGALDFAGGTVVHISSGITALCAAIYLGPRLGYGREPMPPHNLTYTAMGAAMLWFGWFGFNAGSELASDELTTSAFAVTHFSAAAGALGWCFIEWCLRGKPTVLGVSSGAVAGLVCITPAAGFVQPMPSLLMGFVAGIVCYFSCAVIKNKFGYDDSLDAFGVHGVGGTLGAILTGVFATRNCWDIGEGQLLGLMEGGTVLTAQFLATVVTIVFSLVGAMVLLKIVDSIVGLRVATNEERQGLDVQQHGEEGYIFL